MPTLTISINEHQLRHLEQAADRLGVQVADLVQIGIQEYLSRHERFERAADHVLKKNEELYRRLAQ